MEEIGENYFKTLRLWKEAFVSNWEAIKSSCFLELGKRPAAEMEAFKRRWIVRFFLKTTFRGVLTGNHLSIISAIAKLAFTKVSLAMSYSQQVGGPGLCPTRRSSERSSFPFVLVLSLRTIHCYFTRCFLISLTLAIPVSFLSLSFGLVSVSMVPCHSELKLFI